MLRATSNVHAGRRLPTPDLNAEIVENLFIYFIYFFVSRHEVHSMNTHTLQNEG